jgi:hypothetical protein
MAAQLLFDRYVVSTRVRAARNISGFSLPTGANPQVLSVHVLVRMCISMYVLARMYIFKKVAVCACEYHYTCVHIYIYVYIYIYIYMYIYVYIYIYIYMFL